MQFNLHLSPPYLLILFKMRKACIISKREINSSDHFWKSLYMKLLFKTFSKDLKNIRHVIFPAHTALTLLAVLLPVMKKR